MGEVISSSERKIKSSLQKINHFELANVRFIYVTLTIIGIVLKVVKEQNRVIIIFIIVTIKDPLSIFASSNF